MKKYLFHLLYGILVFMIASCTDSETPKLPDAESFDGSNFSISMDDARNELNQLLLDQETAYSRTGVDSKRVIENCYTRSLNPGSRSEKSNFPVYVFNFADDKGFAIMSTDKRTPSLLALAENGNLSDTTEIDNPGFNMYMNLLSIGDIIPNPGTIWTYDGKEYGPWSNLFYSSYLISCDVKWGQGNPYNKFCPMIEGKNTLTGCVPTAVAQLMSAYKSPDSYSDYSFNWSEMTAKPEATSCTVDAQNQIARLMQQLGSSQNLSANYGLNATGAPMHRIPRTLKNFGYSNGGSYIPYDTTEVVNELINRNPVIVEGWTNDFEVGHCWLLHGLMRRTRTVKVHDLETKEVIRTYTETVYYPQCNWGWNGKEDGYYLNGVFDTTKGAPFSDEYSSGITGSIHYPNCSFDFNYVLNAVIGIRK